MTINARSEDDVDEDAIKEQVSRASGSNYSIHKEKAKPVPEPKPVVGFFCTYIILAGYPASLGPISLSSLPILYSPIYHPSLRLGPTRLRTECCRVIIARDNYIPEILFLNLGLS